MQYEGIKDFEGKEVRLMLNNRFLLNGFILKVYRDSIRFTTTQADSIIAISEILSVRTTGG